MASDGASNNFALRVLPAPTSHITTLGLMAQQHASEILPIRLGDLTCNGIICKHDATTLRVLGDQTSRSSCALLLGLVATCGTLAPTQYNMAQLMTRLRTIMSVMKVFEDNPEWKQTRTRYLVDRLKPPGYKGDCKVKNIKLGAVWRQCINEAEKILAIHPNIGTQGSIGIFD